MDIVRNWHIIIILGLNNMKKIKIELEAKYAIGTVAYLVPFEECKDTFDEQYTIRYHWQI